MTTSASPEWSPRTKRSVALVIFLFAVLLLWFLRDALPIVIVSTLIAFVLNPLVTFVTTRVLRASDNIGARRGIAAVISFILVTIVIIITGLVIVPVMVDQVEEFGRRLPRLLTVLENELENYLEQPILFNQEPILIEGVPFVPLDRIQEATGTRDLSQLLQFDQIDLTSAAETFFNSARNLSGPAFSFLGGAFNTMINVIFLLMMTFYLIKDGGMFIDRMIDLVPDEYEDDARRVFQDLGRVWDAYLRGQLILSLVMGIAVYFAALFLGVPNAPILGLLAGMLEFIPNLGPLIALIPAAFLALVSQSATFPFLEGFPFMVVVIVVWTLLQNVEAVFLVPRIMGDSLDLHPFIVTLAVLGGGALAGALGVILAAPFVASARVILRYIYGKLTGRSPFVDFGETETKPGAIQLFLNRVWAWVQARLTRSTTKQTVGR